MRPCDRRLLQATVALLSLVPIGAGGAGVILGPALVRAPAAADLDSHFRYLSGLLLGTGLAFLATVPAIERMTVPFRALAAIVVAGGLGRLLSLLQTGAPAPAHVAALVLELAVVPALAVWQGSVARRSVSHPRLRPPASRGTP